MQNAGRGTADGFVGELVTPPPLPLPDNRARSCQRASDTFPPCCGSVYFFTGCTNQPFSCTPLKTTSAAKRARGPRSDAPPAKKSADPAAGVKTGRAPKREGAAYEQETRKIILTLDRATKATPAGKKLLDNVSVSMYLGAKVSLVCGVWREREKMRQRCAPLFFFNPTNPPTSFL